MSATAHVTPTTTALPDQPQARMSERARKAAGVALLNGWTLDYQENQVLASRTPGGEHEWRLCWSDGRTTGFKLKINGSRASFKRHLAGNPDPPREVRAAISAIEELAATVCQPPLSGPCRCCGVEAPAAAGILLSPVGLCWSCDQRHLSIAGSSVLLTEVPHEMCAKRGHTPECERQVEPFLSEPWRRGPKARLCWPDHDHEPFELAEWLSAQLGTRVTLFTHRHGYEVGFGEIPDLDVALGFSLDHGFSWTCAGKFHRIVEPARHEVLEWLRAHAR